MATATSDCPACGFENPRVWRACARCGTPLAAPRRPDLSAAFSLGGDPSSNNTSDSVPPSTEQLADEQTVVTGQPDFPTSLAGGAAAPRHPGDLDGEPTDQRTLAATRGQARDGASDSASADDDDHGERPDGAVRPPTATEIEPLIGQAEAAEVIRTGVERAFSVGTITLVALEGGRGSGKTRLLTYASEIAARLEPEVRVLYAAVRDADGAYAPFSRVLLDRLDLAASVPAQAARGRLATMVGESLHHSDAIRIAETTHLLGHVAGIPFPDSPFLAPLEKKPDELRKRAAQAVRSLIESDAERRPLLLLLDKMDRVADEGWALFEALTEAQGHIAIVVAGDAPVAQRALSLTPPGGVAVGPIVPMSEADVTSLLHVLLPTLESAPEPLVQALTHRSEGNPGALRELVFSLLEGGLFEQHDDVLTVNLDKLEDGSLPVTLEDAMLARLDRLDALERATLERAAVVGEVFWDGAVLAQMRSDRDPPGNPEDPTSGWPDDDDEVALLACLGRLEAKGFVEHAADSQMIGGREFSFQLAGTRPLLYSRMDDALLGKRHAAVARWLAAMAPMQPSSLDALLAPHLELAGMQEQAGRAYLAAASAEHAKLRTQSALRHIEKALPLIAESDTLERIDALHEHGSLLTTVGSYDAALEAFGAMLRLAWSIGARGKGGAALNRIARVYRQRGEEGRAHGLLERALPLFRAAGDLRGVAATLDDLAQVLRLGAANEAALQAANEGLEIRRAHGDRRGEALSLSTIGSIELGLGHLDVAGSYFSQALSIRQAIGDREGMLQSHNALAVLAFERGDTNTAIESWHAALIQAREMADRRSQSFLLNNIGEALLAANEIERAAEALDEARMIAGALGDRRASAEIVRNIGLLAIKRGDEDAESTLTEALSLAEQYGGREAIALAHRAIGQLRGRTVFDESGAADRRAEESFLVSIDVFREIGNEKEAARSLAELAYHLIERGDADGARERLHEARAIMRRMGVAELKRVEQTLSEIAGD